MHQCATWKDFSLANAFYPDIEFLFDNSNSSRCERNINLLRSLCQSYSMKVALGKSVGFRCGWNLCLRPTEVFDYTEVILERLLLLYHHYRSQKQGQELKMLSPPHSTSVVLKTEEKQIVAFPNKSISTNPRMLRALNGEPSWACQVDSQI